MDKKEQVFNAVTDMINKCVNNATTETIQDVIYESFPMTKVDVVYNNSLKTLSLRIRYSCYGEDQELNIQYTAVTVCEVLSHEFMDNLIYEIGDKIAEKVAEYAAKRRSTESED